MINLIAEKSGVIVSYSDEFVSVRFGKVTLSLPSHLFGYVEPAVGLGIMYSIYEDEYGVFPRIRRHEVELTPEVKKKKEELLKFIDSV